MSVAKNKLQDVYDAGAARLEELGKSQGKALDEAAGQHGKAAEALSQSAAEQTSRRAGELKAEIEAALDGSIGRMSKALARESQLVEKHLQDMCARLATLAHRLSESAHETRDTREEVLRSSADEATEQYERACETILGDIRKQDFSAAKALSVQNTFAINSFTQKMEHLVLESRGEEKQASGKLFKSFLQSSTAVDTAVSRLNQEQSGEFDRLSAELEGLYRQGEARLKQQADELVAEAERLGTELAQTMHEFAERQSFDYRIGFEKSTNDYIAELKAAHQEAWERLTAQVESITEELDAVGGAAAETMERKTGAVETRAEAGMETFSQQCEKRIDSGEAWRRDLTFVSEDILGKARSELARTGEEFERSLNGAVESATLELTSVCERAESLITGARESALKELKAMVEKAESQIDITLEAFLTRIEECRQAAIEEVDRAAAGTADDGTAKKTRKPRPKSSRGEGAPARKQDEKGGDAS